MEFDLLIRGNDEQSMRDVRASLSSQDLDEVQITSRRALDGDIATWTILGTLATSSLRMILTAALKYIELQRVQFIKVGDIEIKNPGREDVTRLISRLDSEPASLNLPNSESTEPPSNHE
jgi:hypothetical protein